MTSDTPAVVAAHPPAFALRVANPLLRFALRTPISGSLRKQFMVVNFAGRKSGKKYSVPVSAHEIDGQLHALVGAQWKLNFRGGAPAQVLYDGRTADMRGELIEDHATVSDLFKKSADAYGARRAQQMMGLKFSDPQEVPSLEDFREAVERERLAAIRLTP